VNAGPATRKEPGNSVLAQPSNTEIYSPAADGQSTLLTSVITSFGSGQPHGNLQPLLCLNFCIALQGIYPSRS
jgi:microcystin-dependent protein